MAVNCSIRSWVSCSRAWFAGMSEEILNGLAALVEELDEDDDAVGGDVGRVAELLDLFFGEGGVGFCAGRRGGRQSRARREDQCGTGHGLVAEDWVRISALHLIEVLERGVEDGTIIAGGDADQVSEAVSCVGASATLRS